MSPRQRRSNVALACALSIALVVARASAAEYQVCIDVTADVRALGSDDAFVWEPAADRLSALGSPAFPVLLRALEHEGPAVREAIVGILANASDANDAVRQGLVRVARSDPAPDVRAVAVPAVRKVAGKASLDVVVAALDDQSPAVRRKAITACSDLCTTDAALARLVTLALGDEPLSNALQAKRVLRGLSKDGTDGAVVAKIRADTLAAAKGNGSSRPETGERRELLAALLLADVGDDSQLDAVARATRTDQTPEIRNHAVHALGRLGGADRVALVAGLLPDPAVAIYAHDALRRMSERGVAGAAAAAAGHAGPRSPQPLPPP